MLSHSEEEVQQEERQQQKIKDVEGSIVLEFFSACRPAQEGGASDGRGGGELGGGQNFGPQGGGGAEMEMLVYTLREQRIKNSSL